VIQTEPAEKAGTAPVINITGEKVALGPSNREHVPLFARWDNDFSVTLFAGDPLRPSTRDFIEANYDRYNKEEPRHWAGFMIYELATLRPIGVTELRNIDQPRRTAEYGISIGEKDCWSKGYGTETTILVLDYAFNVLNLHNVMLDTFAYNERAIRAYTRAGFREIGRRREAQRLGGRVYDIVYMDCLASEFCSPLRPVVELPDLE
jgi:RimJ/RimL family protein N-acetyltransferase